MANILMFLPLVFEWIIFYQTQSSCIYISHPNSFSPNILSLPVLNFIYCIKETYSF